MDGTIICYGDSNTYGHDPVSGGEGRYAPEVRWTGILEKESGCTVRNHGVCGREIPHYGPQTDFALEQLGEWWRGAAPVKLMIMLGTNDLLMTPGFTAKDTAQRMERFLGMMAAHPAVTSGGVELRLIAPPPMKPGSWVDETRLVTESEALGSAYGRIAAKLGIDFTDAGKWDIPVVFDGVHFSAEGHRRFAEGILAELK